MDWILLNFSSDLKKKRLTNNFSKRKREKLRLYIKCSKVRKVELSCVYNVYYVKQVVCNIWYYFYSYVSVCIVWPLDHNNLIINFTKGKNYSLSVVATRCLNMVTEIRVLKSLPVCQTHSRCSIILFPLPNVGRLKYSNSLSHKFLYMWMCILLHLNMYLCDLRLGHSIFLSIILQ